MINLVSLQKSIYLQSIQDSYKGLDCTRIQRLCAYETFNILLEKFPQETLNLFNKQQKNFMSTVFQTYLSVLENKLPFEFIKNKKRHYVQSILDTQLSIFDGISVFYQKVNQHGIIRNATTEMYIGNRNGTYHQPFYIGKLLDIVDVSTHQSLLHQVSSYSFSKINTHDIPQGTLTLVSHLRIIPHYQMGAMVYLNRAREQIISSI